MAMVNYQKIIEYSADITPSDYFIASKQGKPIGNSGVYMLVKKVLNELEIVKRKLSPHVLRHTFCTHLISIGVSLQKVKVVMGHQSISTTAIYENYNEAVRGY